MSVKYPSTVVLFITTHGRVITEGSVPVTFPVPEGMTLTKVSAAAPGVCNVSTYTDDAEFIKTLTTLWNTPNLSDEERIAEAQKKMKTLHNRVLNEIQYAEDPMRLSFIRHGDKGRTAVTYTENQPILEKELVAPIPDETVPYSSKINIVNMPGSPDLLRMIMGKTAAVTRSSKFEVSVSLSQVIHFLRMQGVTKVILFDFSCSTLPEELPVRDARVIRRDFAKMGVNGGKKTRRRKLKTKSRRVKKRRY